MKRIAAFCVSCQRTLLPASVALLVALSFPLEAQQMEQDYRQFEVDRGATLYVSNCAECHGDGTGVPGVNLRTGQFLHGSTDDDLMAVIRDGVPGTMMPPHAFSGPDIVAVVAYVRSLEQDQSPSVKLGDPEQGKTLFENEGGCLNCHRVGGKGSRVALNLSDTGMLHPPSYLERALLDPNSVAAETPESRMVRAVTSKGNVVTGRRLNEDTYTIQLMDDHENLVSLDKADLRSLTILKESPMPSFKAKFTSEQISDLVAYLASLKPAAAQVPTQFGSGPGVGAAFPGRGAGGRGGAASPGGAAGRGTAAPNPPTAPQPGGNR